MLTSILCKILQDAYLDIRSRGVVEMHLLYIYVTLQIVNLTTASIFSVYWWALENIKVKK